MNYLIIIISFFSILLSWKIEKNIYNPISIFSILWFIVVFSASLNLYGIYEASDRTYFIILIGILSFLIGSYTVRFLKGNNRPRRDIKFLIENKENSSGLRSIKIISAIILVIYFQYFIIAIRLILQGLSMSDIKAYATLGKFNVSPLVEISYTYIARPLKFLLVPITLINLFIDKRRDVVLIVLTILIIIFDYTTTGSKIGLFYIVTQVVIIMVLFSNNKNIISLRNKRKMKRIILFLMGVIIYALLATNIGLLKEIYLYVAGSIPHLDIKIKLLDNNQLITYGVTSFQGFSRILLNIIEVFQLGGKDWDLFLVSEWITKNLEYTSYIADGVAYNAFVTIFYFFYADGRIIGVVFGSFLYGIFCERSYINVIKKNNRSNVLYYLLIIPLLVTTIVRFQFSNVVYALQFIYFLLFVKVLKLYK